MTYSIMLLVSHFLLLSLQCKHSLWYNLLFSHSNNFSIDLRVLLLRHTTGHMLHPNVQQQQRHPHSSQRTLIGRFFLRQLLTLLMLDLNSSGATLPVKEDGNSASNLLLRPNTVTCPHPRTTTGSGEYLRSCSSRARSSSSSSSS